MNVKFTLETVRQGRTLIEEKKNSNIALYDLGEERNMDLLLKKRCCGNIWFWSTFWRIFFPYLEDTGSDFRYLEKVHKYFKVDFKVLN